jgi:hypothetical protein
MARRENVFPWKAIIGGVVIFIAIILAINLVCNIDASERVVSQSVSGELSIYESAGYKYQGLSKLTRYNRAIPFDFDVITTKDDKGKTINDVSKCLPIRFNDKGKAHICGSATVEPPAGKLLIPLHEQFGSEEAFMSGLVKAAMSKAVYQTGPLMSSRESAAERRGDLQAYIEDQAKRGYYKKVTKEEKIDDPGAPQVLNKETGEMLPAKKLVKITKPVLDKNANIVIQEKSALAKFKINFYNFAISRIIYSESVRVQIEEQRAREVAIQTAIMQSKRAEQDAKTAKANEVAKVAEKRAEMEVIKIEEVTQAEKTRDVAKLDLEKAELDAQAVIAKGKADAEARRLKMAADGALTQKLKALVEINKHYAVALAKAQPGALVPHLNMGGGNKTGSAQDLVQLLTAQTARQLSVDVTPK